MKSHEYKPTHGGYPTYRRGAMWFNPRDRLKAPSYKLGDPDVIEQLRPQHQRLGDEGSGCGSE